MIDKELVADDNWCPDCGEPRGIGHCFTCKPSAPAPERPRSEVEEAREWLDEHHPRMSLTMARYWANIPELLIAFASHIRHQERERAAKKAESFCGDVRTQTHAEASTNTARGIAAAIRES